MHKWLIAAVNGDHLVLKFLRYQNFTAEYFWAANPNEIYLQTLHSVTGPLLLHLAGCCLLLENIRMWHEEY